MLPGATIGVLGGGQLGRMLMVEAHRMKYRVHVLDPDPDCPCASRADLYIQGRFDDAEAAVRLAEGCDVVTLETEHIPAEVLDQVARHRPLHLRNRPPRPTHVPRRHRRPPTALCRRGRAR